MADQQSTNPHPPDDPVFNVNVSDDTGTDTPTDPTADKSAADVRARQLARRAKIEPSIFAKAFVNHTKKTCAITCLIPLLAIALIILSGAFQLDNPQGRDYFVRNDILTRQADARAAARDLYEYVEEGANASQTLVNGEYDAELSITLLLRGKYKNSDTVASTNDFEDAFDILNPKSLALQKRAEDAIINHSNYSQFCLSSPGLLDCEKKPRKCEFPRSFTNHPNLYGIYDKETGIQCGRREENGPVPEDNFIKFRDSLFGADPDLRLARNFFDRNLTNGTDGSAWAAYSVVTVGWPFVGAAANDSDEDEQVTKFNDWADEVTKDLNDDLSDRDQDVYPISEEIANNSFGSIVLRDLAFSVVAIILVFLVIWFHTSSVFLAATAMTQIFLSFPVTFVLYHFVFRQLYFAALQILTIFLVLGIGADDVFVFTDAWKQAPVVLGADVDLVTRMTWTYRRAVRAMTVTSFTTAAAFFVTASSPIMPISTLGIWAGGVIVLQFLLVITLYPCAMVIWHRFWRPRMAVRCFRKVPDANVEKEVATPLWHRCLPAHKRPAVRAPGEYRAIERFFGGPWFNVLRRIRFVIIGLAVAAIAVAIWLATELEAPEETENFLPDDNPIRVALDTRLDAFPRSDEDYLLKVRFVWGIKDVDRAGTTRFDVAELGKPVFDDMFDLKRKVVQEHILQTCKQVEDKHENLLFQDSTGIDRISCWIEDYLTWRQENKTKTGFDDFNSDKALVDELIEFGEHVDSNGTKPYLHYLIDQRLIFHNNKVVVTEVSFVSDTEASLPAQRMWPIYQEWQGIIDKHNEKAPEGGNTAIVTSGYPWLYSVTQRTLLRSMVTGLGIMVVVALFTLMLATLNWLVAILATLSIAGVVSMLLGFIRLYGWSLGISESVGVVIGVGFSFDGIAHVATAYVESKSATRVDRTKDALTDLGISVLFGAITTLLAGICLLPAIIIFFTKFAGLILTTIVLSMVWSLAVFPCLLMSFGPENKTGSIAPYFKALAGLFRKKNDATRDEHDNLEAGITENVGDDIQREKERQAAAASAGPAPES